MIFEGQTRKLSNKFRIKLVWIFFSRLSGKLPGTLLLTLEQFVGNSSFSLVTKISHTSRKKKLKAVFVEIFIRQGRKEETYRKRGQQKEEREREEEKKR